MIKLLVYIKHHFTFIWRIVECFNSVAVGLRYQSSLKEIRAGFGLRSLGNDVQCSWFNQSSINDLVLFFETQKEEHFDFFRPHKFDKASLERIAKENNYLAFCFYNEGKVVGYCFLRLFFTGKAFTGLISHQNYQGKGLGKQMIKVLFEVADILDIEVYSTISKENVGSLKSHAAIRSYKIEKNMPNNYLMLKFNKK